jgi:hypothetical protein
VCGLLRDKTRPSRIPPLGSDIAERVVALTRTDPPVEPTHWTPSMMAKPIGISASSVQRIWHAHGLQRHRVQQFNSPTTRSSSTSCATWSGFMSIRPPSVSDDAGMELGFLSHLRFLRATMSQKSSDPRGRRWVRSAHSPTPRGYTWISTASIGTPISCATGVHISTSSASVSMLTTNTYRAPTSLRSRLGQH